MEVSAFMTEQLKEQLQLQRDHDEKVRAEMEAKLTAQHAVQTERDAQAKAEKAELEAKFEAKLEKQHSHMKMQLEKQRDDMTAQLKKLRSDAKPEAASEAVLDEQLEAFQERLQSLHSAKLLTEDELCILEDTIADCIEVCPTADVEERTVDKTLRMLRLSEKMKADSSLARQLRRKFVS